MCIYIWLQEENSKKWKGKQRVNAQPLSFAMSVWKSGSKMEVGNQVDAHVAVLCNGLNRDNI
tara:strand:+ start:302 stop:487 length:186 start_codon:yes stop_codon:yes gene_type:complete